MPEIANFWLHPLIKINVEIKEYIEWSTCICIFNKFVFILLLSAPSYCYHSLVYVSEFVSLAEARNLTISFIHSKGKIR